MYVSLDSLLNCLWQTGAWKIINWLNIHFNTICPQFYSSAFFMFVIIVLGNKSGGVHAWETRTSTTTTTDSQNVLYHDSMTVRQHAQHKDSETEAATSNSAIRNCIIYTCSFPIVSCQDVLIKNAYSSLSRNCAHAACKMTEWHQAVFINLYIVLQWISQWIVLVCCGQQWRSYACDNVGLETILINSQSHQKLLTSLLACWPKYKMIFFLIQGTAVSVPALQNEHVTLRECCTMVGNLQCC